MRKVIGVGETILDIIFEKNKPTAAVPGGSVFNALVSLGRLDVPVEFISEVGKDRVGTLIKDFMQENNVSTHYVDSFQEGKSAISLAFLNERNEAEYSFYKDYPKRRLDVDFPVIEPNDIVIFGSFYSVNPVLRDRIVELMEYAQKQRAIIYYDPNFRAPHANDVLRLSSMIIENLEYASIVRGSHEDFYHLFGMTDVDKVYKQKVSFYCPHFICTQAEKGIELRTPLISKHYESRSITPVSTIGAGDNFNAGILYGLLKLNVTYDDLQTLSESLWDKIIAYATAFSTNVCLSYDNYISHDFAQKIKEGAIE